MNVQNKIHCFVGQQRNESLAPIQWMAVFLACYTIILYAGYVGLSRLFVNVCLRMFLHIILLTVFWMMYLQIDKIKQVRTWWYFFIFPAGMLPVSHHGWVHIKPSIDGCEPCLKAILIHGFEGLIMLQGLIMEMPQFFPVLFFRRQNIQKMVLM